nr:replication protein A 70 kDa DNA-binding subunit B [Tanacetum cinerariifolium]
MGLMIGDAESVMLGDETRTMPLSLFRDEVHAMVGRSVYQLCEKYAKSKSDGSIPMEITNLIGIKYAFKVSIDDYNVKKLLPVFTVLCFSNDQEIINSVLACATPIKDNEATSNTVPTITSLVKSQTDENTTPNEKQKTNKRPAEGEPGSESSTEKKKVVEIKVETGTMSLSLFNDEVQAMVGHSAYQLCEKYTKSESDGSIPTKITNLIDNKYAFKVAIDNYNVKKLLLVFIVLRFSNDQQIINSILACATPIKTLRSHDNEATSNTVLAITSLDLESQTEKIQHLMRSRRQISVLLKVNLGSESSTGKKKAVEIKVVHDKRTRKTKGYGFVSFANPTDLAGAFKEMNGVRGFYKVASLLVEASNQRMIKINQEAFRNIMLKIGILYMKTCDCGTGGGESSGYTHSELASLFGKLKYKENLIDNIYETEKSKSLVSVTPLSTAFFSTSIVQVFQDSPDDEEDTRIGHEYLNDLEEEYQAKAFLAKSKRFFKNGIQRNTKDFEAKYNKVKAKLALFNSNALAPSSFLSKNKGLIAKSHDWDEEEVSLDDEEMKSKPSWHLLTKKEFMLAEKVLETMNGLRSP